MTTRDSIDAQQAYLERLHSMRQREKEHLSQVDFTLFISRFDRLISKVEAELQRLRAGQFTQNAMQHMTCLLLDTADVAVVGSDIFFDCSSLAGANVRMLEYNTVVVGRPALGSIQASAGWLDYPTQISMQVIAVRNSEAAFKRAAQFSSSRMAQASYVQ